MSAIATRRSNKHSSFIHHLGHLADAFKSWSHKRKKKLKTISKNVVYTEEQIQAKQVGQKNKNTIKTEERANPAFCQFLKQCRESDLDYWNYEEPELDSYLSKLVPGKVQILIVKVIKMMKRRHSLCNQQTQ